MPAIVPIEVDDRNRILDRGDLIGLAASASDAVASGGAVPDDVEAADGRRFQIRLPFGCEGPAAADSGAPMRWSYDAALEALRISVTPVRWQPGDWSIRPRQDVETIEGYWVPRPWTASEACPPERAQTVGGSEPVTLPGQTLALAQFFDAASPRQARRGDRPYQSVVRIAPGAIRGEQGLRLRLDGRITRTPNGAPVLCRQPAGSEQRPICVIAVKIDEVAIENPAPGGETLATWTTERPAER